MMYNEINENAIEDIYRGYFDCRDHLLSTVDVFKYCQLLLPQRYFQISLYQILLISFSYHRNSYREIF